jgi:general stress protein YciG
MKNPHAVALGKLGGKARIAQMAPEQVKEWGRLGGLARAERHTKEEISRWGKMGGRPPKRARTNGDETAEKDKNKPQPDGSGPE